MHRCPHCNAPLTRVDGEDPTECPYCHTILTPQRATLGSPGRTASRSPVLLLVLLGVGGTFIAGVVSSMVLLRGTDAPQPAPVARVDPPPPQPAPVPKIAEPPTVARRVLAFGEEGTNPGQLHSPTHLAVASDGSILVGENATGRVQRFGADGAYQAAVVMPPDKLTKRNGIFGMATDASGRLYVNRVGDVLVYDAATLEVVRTLSGDYPDRYYHGGLAVDGVGNVLALTDRMGDTDLVTTSPAGKLLSRRRVHAKDVAVDGTGDVFLLGDDALEVQDAKGAVVSKVGVRGRSVAFDGKGHIFVATGSMVEVLSPEGARLITLPIPAGKVALDRAGKLYALQGSGVEVYELTLP